VTSRDGVQEVLQDGRGLPLPEDNAGLLVQVVDLLHGGADPDSAIDAVLRLCQSATAADLCLLLRREAGMLVPLGSGVAGLDLADWPDPWDLLATVRLVAELEDIGWSGGVPGPLRPMRSLLSVPLDAPSRGRLAIVLMARQPAAFAEAERGLIGQVGQLLVHALDGHRPGDVDSRAGGGEGCGSRALAAALDPAGADPSFAALNRAYARMSEWQARIVEITNAVLIAGVDDPDRAIDRALARTGALAQSDRCYIFRLRDPDRMDNTHEWVAPGIEAMIDRSQDLPVGIMDDWAAAIAAGQPIHVPDCQALGPESSAREVMLDQGIRSLLAMPMLRDGRVVGLLGFDAVRAPRRFLAMEIQLLGAVANAVNVVLARAEAEARAEAARAGLEAERNRLRAMLMAIPDLLLELDRDGRFVGHVAGSGLQPAFPVADFLGRLPEEVLPPALATLARQVMARVDREGRVGWQEYQLDVDGSPNWFNLSAAVRTEAGRPAGYVFVIRNVSSRLQERRQLQRLGKIAALTSNLVMITDVGGRIEWVNPAFELRTGWSLDEVRGKAPCAVLSAPETDPATLARIKTAVRDGTPVQLEMLQRSRTGERYWVRKDIQPVLDEQGRLEGFVSVHADITELKILHQQALDELDVALDASRDGIGITDAAGHYVYMNDAHRRMFGIDPHEDIRRLNWRDLIPAEAVRRLVEQEWGKLDATGTWLGEVPGLHRDGHVFPQEVSLTRQQHRVLYITRDITDRRQLEMERARLREELQLAERRETVAYLTSGVAHDLNNLMAVIGGSASLLVTRCAADPDARAGVERILSATDSARDLVGGLGMLARPKRPRGVQDLRKMITEGVELLGSQRIRDHAVRAELPDHPCRVWANVTELLQVIVNLSLNACEAGGTGPNHVTLTIPDPMTLPARDPDAGFLRPDRPHVVFAVSDTGAGIDEEARKRLFDRYFTTKGAAGTGLGLPIVAGILRDNDAAMWLDSRPGAGTAVTVAWPSQPPDPRPEAGPAGDADGPADLSGCNILVVDDLPYVADVLSEMLDGAGATSVVSSNPREAAELLASAPGMWAALVTDLDMPEIQGTVLARQAMACTPPIPVVLVTALPEALGTERHLFQAVLSKPISAQALVAAVGAAVAARPR